jgi:hypothetical protein
MPSLLLPPDLAQEAVVALRWDRAPAVRKFLDLVRAERAWSPTWPRRLVTVSEHLGLSMASPRYVRLLLAGFGPSYIVAAIAVLTGIAVRVLVGREQRVIYAGRRGLLIFDSVEPPRHGPGATLPPPMRYPSFAGAGETPPATSPEAGPRPWGRGEILTR